MISAGFTVGAALAAWWKNNSFTPEAIEADDFMARLKKSVHKNVAVFVAVFFVRLRANKKKSYKSVKF